MTFTASLRSELKKIKRTSVPYVVLITAIVTPFFMVFDQLSPELGKANVSSWDKYFIEGQMVMTFAFLPLFLVLVSTLLLQIEIRNNAWKQVLASPQSFFHIVLAKFIVLQFMTLIVLAGYNVCMMLGAVLLDVFPTDRNFLTYMEQWEDVLRINLLTYGSTLGISGLSFWLALRFKNFITPIAIGFLLWLIGAGAVFEFKWLYVDRYVFAIPFTVLSEKFENEMPFYQFLSMGYSVVFVSIAYLEFAFQRIHPRQLLNGLP